MHIVIDGFIAAWAIFAWTWTAPAGSPFAPLRERLRPWVVRLGLAHAWNMFAPDPIAVSRWAEVLVTLRDGSTVAWSFGPRRPRGLLARLLSVRRRKFQSSLFNKRHPALRGAVFHFIGRELAAMAPARARLDCIQILPPPPGSPDGSEPSPRRLVIAEHIFG